MIKSLIVVLIAASTQMLAECVLQEGVGADFGKIGVTTRQTIGTLPDTILPDWRRGVLYELFVTGGNCRTSKGIGVGDSETNVKRVYGKGKKTVAYLEKGKGDRIGRFGDYILEYRGAAFVIEKEKVAAFFIRH